MNRKQTIIIGAGNAGKILLNAINEQKHMEYDVIGFLDDDEEKIGRKIDSFPIINNIDSLNDVAQKFNVDVFIIAIPSASGQRISEIVRKIHETKKDFMIVQPIFDNLEINRISKPRKIELDDIIKRPVKNILNDESMKKIRDSKILITGVAGSIGSEIAKQIAGCNPKRIYGLDFSETGLFHIKNEIDEQYSNVEFIPLLKDIKNKTELQKIFLDHNIDIIYHCAAYKHVGLMEKFPQECIKNNILGSINLIKLAIGHNISRFVFVSTDKAVYPTSIMGSSKRIIEKYILNVNKRRTKFMIVRFGNVLKSNGSAINIFQKQLEQGKPITITDKRMERYFMNINEAAQLVIQASIMGKGGELFVLNMGKPHKIVDIVEKLIEIFGYEPDNYPIKYIGIREGEKLSEELFYDFEQKRKTMHNEIFICENYKDKDKNYNYIKSVHKLVEIPDNYEKKILKRKIQDLVQI